MLKFFKSGRKGDLWLWIFEYEELTEHYIGQLTKVAKNLSDEEYVEGHKGEKVRMYKETTVMTVIINTEYINNIYMYCILPEVTHFLSIG